ncbi:MAG: Holliday junction branch migration protein RuvA [Deltaproteobacteria bacterium]|nr:Holliday junction branch migration protein RuvA [Deltaproteobacteria bacterium]
MIARLRGTLVERGADTVVIECGGVGYEVTVSLSTLAAIPEPGSEVALRIFTHAQENRVALYGFATSEERELFDRLITVKNVGPATAIETLSGAPTPRDLARMVAHGDLASLTRIRGVGKKRAEMLVVELKEKCQILLAGWGVAAEDAPTRSKPLRKGTRPPILDELASALVNLGYRPTEAEKHVALLEVPAGASIETLLRDALRAMPR